MLNIFQQQQQPGDKRGGGGGDPIYNSAGMRMVTTEELRENPRDVETTSIQYELVCGLGPPCLHALFLLTVLNIFQQQQQPGDKRGGGGGDPIYNSAGMRMTTFEELRENSREMKKKIMGELQLSAEESGTVRQEEQDFEEWQQRECVCFSSCFVLYVLRVSEGASSIPRQRM